MPDSDSKSSIATPARLRPGRIFLYAVIFFLLLTAGSIAWKLATMRPPPMPEGWSLPGAAAPANARGTTTAPEDDRPPPAPEASTDPPSKTAGPRAIDLAPASLKGTEVDGAITIRDGRIIPDLALRRLYDYFLSALGEKSLADIRIWLAAYLREQHGSAITTEALDLFDRYVTTLQAIQNGVSSNLDPRSRQVQLTELRQRLLGAELAEAFFGAEARYLDYTLDRLDLMRDSSLTSEERAKRLETLAQALPESERPEHNDSTLGMLVDEQTQQLDALNVSEAERFAEREALVGEAAAQRLAELDTTRAQWQARIDRYKAAWSAIQNNPSLDANTRAARSQALLESSFNESERRRVLSLQAIGQL